MLKIDHQRTPYMRLHYDLRAPYLLHTHCTTLVCVIIFLIPIRLERDCCAKNLTGVNANYVSSHSAHHQVIRQYVEILYIFSSLSRVLFQIKKKTRLLKMEVTLYAPQDEQQVYTCSSSKQQEQRNPLKAAAAAAAK